MKKLIYFTLSCILLLSCASKNEEATVQRTGPVEMEEFSFNDSSQYCHVEIKGIIPVAADSVTQAMRDTMVSILERSLMYGFTTEDNKPAVQAFTGEKDNIDKVMTYYGNSMMAFAEKQFEDSEQQIEADTTLTDVDKKAQENYLPKWVFSMEVTKIMEDSLYLVMNDNDYIDLGGAHGGIAGAGAITFNVNDGSRITKWLKDDVTMAMQPLLKKGLKEYFKECGEDASTDKKLMDCLQLCDKDGNPINYIPLPKQYNLCPDKDGRGLVFTYAQYEIACYAAGMPSFILTYEELKDFLLPQQ